MRLLILIFIIQSCGLETKAKASGPKHITCEFLDAWDFKRCENEEVVCYTNDQGLSCKFK